MQIATPIIHLEKEGADTYHLHVITWFDQTKFKADGHDTVSTSATNGIFTVTLYVAEDGGVPNMQLLTPVVHTLTLTGVELSSMDPFVEVEVVNTTESENVSKRKTHKDTASNSAMPDPGSKKA